LKQKAPAGFTSRAGDHVQAANQLPVDPVRGLSDNLNGLALVVEAQQDGDLTYTVQNVNEEILTNNDTVSYWIGQFVDAAIWGAAVFPEESLGQMGLAVMASLFGGALGSSGPPQQASYSDFRTAIDNTYLNSLSQNGANETTVLGDAALLSVVGTLAAQSWQWDPTESPDIAQSAQNANRIAFYQVLIPVRYQMVQYIDNETSYPYVVAQQEAPWSYWSEPGNINGTYNVYMLAYPDTLLHPYGFPTQTLMNDLFQNLGGSQEQFFLCQGGWSGIPQVSSNDNSDAAKRAQA
jgi:hypothetical protein